jgi:hypothetical protein
MQLSSRSVLTECRPISSAQRTKSSWVDAASEHRQDKARTIDADLEAHSSLKQNDMLIFLEELRPKMCRRSLRRWWDSYNALREGLIGCGVSTKKKLDRQSNEEMEYGRRSSGLRRQKASQETIPFERKLCGQSERLKIPQRDFFRLLSHCSNPYHTVQLIQFTA